MSERKLRKLNTKEVSPVERELLTFLESRIVGQPAATAALGRAYRTGLNPIANPRRPRAVLIFAGPSRTGKSYSVECAAEFCHGSPDAMIELEGGELQKEHEVMKLTGAPPSYIGYKPPADNQESGEEPKFDPSAKLAKTNLEASRRGSKCPIVWIRINEIEKAHPALYDLLLGGTDNGKINLGNNQSVDLSNCVIIMTSNLGMKEFQRKELGFVRREKTTADVKSMVHAAMTEEFRPEFNNRIDEVVIFNPLGADEVRRVVDFEIARIQERILKQTARGHLFVLDVDDKAKDFILEQSDKSNGGVSDMKRTLKVHLEDVLGNELLKRSIHLGDKVIVTYEKGDETLSFYIDEEGAIIPGADKLNVADNQDSHDGLVFQRQVDLAAQRSARLPKSLFGLTLGGDSLEELAKTGSYLVKSAREIFALQLVESGCRWEKPLVFKAVVRGTDEQIKLFKSKHPEVVVVRQDGETKATN
jgi:hypothetical protein